MPDASPSKWHLAHTSWFFEEFVLKPHAPGYEPFDPRYAYLFNSYYDAVGPRHARAARGLLSRPSLDEIGAYRRHVDRSVARFLEDGATPEPERVIVLGMHHEEQHQELVLTDIKHAFGINPLQPAYGEAAAPSDPVEASRARFVPRDAGLVRVGHVAAGFAFDNEGPRHRAFLEAYELSDRLVTVGEYLQFMADGGYARADLWLAEAQPWLRAEGIKSPLYWDVVDGAVRLFDLRGGSRPLNPAEPVCHVSYYEADAYARWAGARLPTELEWEAVAAEQAVSGNLFEQGRLHPRAAAGGVGFQQLFGDVWEWTQSAYAAYPGYRPQEGALGEYNGKFMCNQFVLRGGSCLTPQAHVRHTYRNFFPAGARWQMTGLRLARSPQN